MKEKNSETPINETYNIISNEKYIRLERLHSTPKYLEYRDKWIVNPKNLIIENAPLHLDIETTNACNLKCPMCPRTILIGKKDPNFKIGFMNFDLYKKIIDEAAEIGVYSIKLMWLGEPLMHKDIIKMINYAKNKGIIDVMMNTNAVLLTEQMSNKILNSGLDKLIFSFDSPNKETYEKIRVGANFVETLENIKNFSKIRDLHEKTKPLTTASMIKMKNNSEEVNDFVNLFKDIVDAVGIQDYVEYNTDNIDFNSLLDDYALNSTCKELWQRLIINWNGACGPCCHDSNLKINLGNVKNSSIREIWNGKKLNNLRNIHLKKEWKNIEPCTSCQAIRLASQTKRKDGSL